MMSDANGPLYMATATIDNTRIDHDGSRWVLQVKAPRSRSLEDRPGVVALDRGPVDGDDLDELYERWNWNHTGRTKLRYTSYDRDKALAAVQARYDELTKSRPT